MHGDELFFLALFCAFGVAEGVICLYRRARLARLLHERRNR